MSDLTERVARAIQQTSHPGVSVSDWDAISKTAKSMFRAEARAAIALVIEEAARVMENRVMERYGYDRHGDAAAIRALKEPT